MPRRYQPMPPDVKFEDITKLEARMILKTIPPSAKFSKMRHTQMRTVSLTANCQNMLTGFVPLLESRLTGKYYPFGIGKSRPRMNYNDWKFQPAALARSEIARKRWIEFRPRHKKFAA